MTLRKETTSAVIQRRILWDTGFTNLPMTLEGLRPLYPYHSEFTQEGNTYERDEGNDPFSQFLVTP